MSTTSQPIRSPLRLVVSLVVVALLAVALRYALPKLQLHDVWAHLRRAHLLPLVGAALAALSMHFFRAMFWRRALIGCTIPLRRLFRYTILGSAASAILPARAGEAVRVWLLAELEGVPAVTGVGTALAERALDVVSMMIVLVPLPWLLPAAPPSVIRALYALSAVAVVIVVIVFVVARRGRSAVGDSLIARMSRALAALSSPVVFVRGVGDLLAAWLADIAAILAVAYALDLSLPWAAPLLILLSVNLAIAIPAAPAQIGSHEAGTIVALGLLNVPTPDAVAFALLYHAAHVLPLLVAAAFDGSLLLRALRR